MELRNGRAARPHTRFEDDVADMIAAMADWDVGLDGPIARTTRLVGDLGFQSLDIVMLILAIEGCYERRDLPFDEVLMVDGEYVSDLTVGDLADFLALHVAGAAR